MKGAILFFLLCTPALADLAAGLKAYKSGDYAGALGEFLPLAKQGNAVAQFTLGLMYYNGEGVPQDDKEAVRWYRLAATQRSASAQSNLGVMYLEGRGVPQDDKEAIRLFRLAAEQGDPHASPSAQTNLGVMYSNGQGTQKDDKEAVRWFRLAAEQGDPDAQVYLGSSYEEGQGVPQDYVQAYMWFNLAGAASNATGIKGRDIVLSKMTLDQIAEAQRRAREWKPQASRNTMQPSRIVDWHQIVGITGATWGLVVATWLLAIIQRSTAKKQLDAYRLSLSADAVLKFDTKFNERTFQIVRSSAAKALLKHTNEAEAEEVFDFFDTVGLFVRIGAMNDEVAHGVFFHWINLYWKAGKQYIGSKQAETKNVWKDFETLYDRVCVIESRDKNSEDLTMPESRLQKQLQEEVELVDG